MLDTLRGAFGFWTRTFSLEEATNILGVPPDAEELAAAFDMVGTPQELLEPGNCYFS